MACQDIMTICLPGETDPGTLQEPSEIDVRIDSKDSETLKITNVKSRGNGGQTKEIFKSGRVTRQRSDSTDPDDSSGDDIDNSANNSNNAPINPRWSQFTSIIHSIIQGFVVTLAVHAARNPKTYVVAITVLSFALIATGFFTNFHINTDEQVIYAPFKSKTASHNKWRHEESNFPGSSRVFSISMHGNGDNIMGADNIRSVFNIVDEVRATSGYHELCARGDYVNFDNVRTCKIIGVTRFFQHDLDNFEKEYEEGGEDAILETISADSYENMAPSDTDATLGNLVRDNETNLITYTESYNVFILLPDIEGSKDVERLLIARFADIQMEWDIDDNILTLEYFSMRSYSDEFARAIEKDLYLLPVVFFLMSGFTCLVFFRCDRVQSRSVLGVGSVVTILLALMSSFGIMFIIGVPFTSMTQILPFVVFGVGLDDTFIITGAYFRTDPDKEPAERIREAMQDIGLSISVTTITTMFAFILGCMSTIPAIYWLNLYAFPTILIDYLFQTTFFVALIVLDERRIQANRSDCCMCVKVVKNDKWEDEVEPQPQRKQQKTLPERFMKWYANKLLRPWTKAIVVVVFLAYAGFCAYTTTLLTQEFDFNDLLPADSYVTDFMTAMESYTSRLLAVGIYFRGDFDQMDPDIQRQMNQYVDEISALPQFADSPPFCWFRDFETFMESDYVDDLGFDFENMTTRQQLDFGFSIPAIQETYGKHVVRDEDGRITASRCYTYVSTDLKVVQDQIKTLKDQRAVSARQPINQGKDDWSFFTQDSVYFLWEFYAVAIEELIFTTISGVAAVCGIGFFFFPHWMAVFFVFPLMVMLYINLLGTLQYAGIHINAVTYVCLVISIGLMVDFIVHVLLRYYESNEKTRENKVKDTLETMGASILVGGISTSLGVLPLALSTSQILQTVFICFFAMIVLGVTHGLVFLPVLLAICGPTRNGHSSDPIEGTGDLVLKRVGDSDTDESDSDDEVNRRAGLQQARGDAMGDSTRSVAGPSRYDAILHSQTTFRDESLEVMRWNADTMAWI